MQYLVSVIDDKSNPGSTDRQPAISAFNERLIAEGYWVFAGGLAAPARPPSSTTGASRRCSATGLSWSRRSDGASSTTPGVTTPAPRAAQGLVPVTRLRSSPALLAPVAPGLVAVLRGRGSHPPRSCRRSAV